MKKNNANDKLSKLLKEEISFAMLIKSIRTRDGLTQKALARKLDVSVSHISDIENSRKFVSVERAAYFAKKLGDSEKFFVMVALQDLVTNSGLEYEIKVA
jgi:transcriptional regulator with XRE-family HTH domain